MADGECNTKRCSQCGEVKALRLFSKHRGRADGMNDSCKACNAAYRRAHRDRDLAKMAEYRKNNPEKLRALNTLWRKANMGWDNARSRQYRRANPERVKVWKATDASRHRPAALARSKRYYEANKPASHRAAARWAKANPQKARRFVKNWEIANPEAVAAKANRRRARKMSAPGRGVTRVQWKEILAASLGLCAYCCQKKKLTMDHIDPIARGGAHDIDNVAGACRFCNQSKNDTTVVVWMAKKALGRAELRAMVAA